MVVRYAVANVAPETVAARGQAAGLAGSVSQGFGFGTWGMEPTTFLEFGGVPLETADAFVRALLREHSEVCAYRTVNGAAPSLVYAEEGHVEELA